MNRDRGVPKIFHQIQQAGRERPDRSKGAPPTLALTTTSFITQRLLPSESIQWIIELLWKSCRRCRALRKGLLGRPATIDENIRSCDEACILGAQVESKTTNFLRTSPSAERDL